MKKLFNLTIVLLCIIFFIVSCKKSDNPPPLVLPLADNSLPSAAIINVQLLNKSANTIEYALDITVFRDSKNLETQLKPENFLNDTLSEVSRDYFFSLQEASIVNGSSAQPYSALMLMDQSGSIADTDPYDYRIDAAKTFCNNLGHDDNVMLWSFAASSSYYSKDLVQYGTGFVSDINSLIPDIESLNGKEEGGTPLYFSQRKVTDYCAANAPSANKAVMTFTDGEDNGSLNGYSTTIQQVINNAVSRNVKLYNIGLGSAQTVALSSQATATGGAFMFAQDARQLISMFGNLGKLLNGTATYYHTVWKVTKSTGNFTIGNLSYNATISLPYGQQVIVPFSLDY